jgi:hypothetical protein
LSNALGDDAIDTDAADDDVDGVGDGGRGESVIDGV